MKKSLGYVATAVFMLGLASSSYAQTATQPPSGKNTKTPPNSTVTQPSTSKNTVPTIVQTSPAAQTQPTTTPFYGHGERPVWPDSSKQNKNVHPEIQRARSALETAKKELARSSHDYDGHRAKAIENISRALRELDQAQASGMQ